MKKHSYLEYMGINMYITQKEYIRKKGASCPNEECGAPGPDDWVEWRGYPEWENGRVVRAPLKCTFCKTEWEEVYEFKRYDLT